MFKRFFKAKSMTEEIKNDAPQEVPGTPVPEGVQMPGVDVETGKPVGTVNQPDGVTSQPVTETPVPEAPGGSDPAVPTPPEPTPEVPAANDETIPEATVSDPMKPVGPN